MTPNDIDVLLHYHCSPGDHPRLHAPAVAESIAEFTRAGILYYDGLGKLRTTDKGVFFVGMLCNTPYPTNVFIDPRGYNE